ncbi:MAG: Dabb family protein [Microthrixaceae bacterium]
MLHHVVLLRFKESTTPGAITAITESLMSLESQISTLRYFSVNTDLGLAADNAHMIIMAMFDDQAGYEFYRDHPAHQKVIREQISEQLVSRSAAQYAS